MDIKIWSDIRCPFCYIGKRRMENALKKFAHADHVKVSWYSFELDPNLRTQPDVNAADHLAAAKGLSREQVQAMMDNVTTMGKEEDLQFDFEKAVVANSFNAHRLLQFAKTRGLGDVAKEVLFKAHFESGQNIDDKTSLRELGISIGLPEIDLDQVLFTDAYEQEVRRDEKTAAQIGISGVPFFVVNNKFAISGAQPESVFLDTLNKAWQEQGG